MLRSLKTYPLVNSYTVRGLLSVQRRTIMELRQAAGLPGEVQLAATGRSQRGSGERRRSSTAQAPFLKPGRPQHAEIPDVKAKQHRSAHAAHADAGASTLTRLGDRVLSGAGDIGSFDDPSDRISIGGVSSSVASGSGEGASATGVSSIGSGTGGAGSSSRAGDAAELVALRYEEDMVSLSAQVLEAELENARLRHALEGDPQPLLEALDDAERRAKEGTAAARAAEARADVARADAEEMRVEMEALRRSLTSRTAEAQAARERVAALAQHNAMLEAQARDLGSRLGASAATKGSAEAVMRQQVLDLFAAALALRARVAELTPDAGEYARFSRVEGVTLEDVLREEPSAGLTGPGSPPVSMALATLKARGAGSSPPSDRSLMRAGAGGSFSGGSGSGGAGGGMPYAELQRRLELSASQNTRMRAGLKAAAEHIRELREELTVAQEASVDRIRLSASATAVATLQGKLRRAEETNASYRVHLARARDALLAAKAAEQRRDENSAGAAAAAVASRLLEQTRAELLVLQERNGKLSLDRDQLRSALAAAAEALEVDAEDSSLLNRFRAAERRVGELLADNSRLASLLDTAEGRVAHVTVGFERKIQSLLQQFEVERAARRRRKASVGSSGGAGAYAEAPGEGSAR